MGIFDSKKSILTWAREQVSKMSATVADTIRHIFQVKWSYSARRDALAYLDLFHTTPRLDPVDMISTDCANSPFKVFAKTDLRAGKNDADPLLDHPVFDLLDNPIPSRPDIDGFTLRYLTHVWWELQGDCYWIVVKDASNRPREIYPIPSNWVISAPTISIPYFLVMPQGNTASQSLLVAPENVVWFKSPNVAQPYARGRGRAEAIGDELETDEYAAKFAKNLFFNDGTPKSAVIAPGANQETLNQLRQNWNQAYQGVSNASKTAFLGADMKMQILSTSPRELDFVASREFLRNAPLEHWNIPPEMMGILNNSNRATIESAKYLYMSGPVANRCMRFDSMVNRQLMPMFDARFVIKTEPAIPEDKEFNLKVSTEGWTSGAITRGEWRLRNGLSKFGNPADDEVQESFNVTMRKINATGSAKPDETGEDQESGDDDVALSTVPQDDNQPAEDEPLPPQPDEQVPVNGTPGLSPEKRAKSFSVDQRRKAWQAFDKAAGATEGPYKKAVKKIADRQQEEFNAAFSDSLKQGLSPSIALSTATLSVFGDEENAAVQKELYSSWMNSMQGGLRLANNVLDTSVSFSVVQPAFRAWIDEHGLEKAQDINDTTKELLANSLGDGIVAGESTVELETRISDQFDGLRDYRTERIARTESAGSMNFGSTAAYKSAGVEKKSWLAVQDDRTRDEHLDADGTVAGIDEPFVVGGEELMYPGDPSGSAENVINCFVPGTMVEGAFDAASKSWYSGKIVVIKTRRGHTLTITANHPILTPQGWVKAKDLSKGVNVLADSRDINRADTLVDENNNRVPAEISQIFEAFRSNGTLRTEVISALDFHGDGQSGNGNVEIVSINRELPLDIKPVDSLKDGHDVYLVEPSLALVSIMSDGLLQQLSPAGWLAPSSDVGSIDLPSHPFGIFLDLFPLQGLGFGRAAQWNTGLGKMSAYGNSWNPDFFGKLVHAGAGQISLDEIVEIGEENFSGHVYDLQSVDNFIMSNGIIASNCRCSILPEFGTDNEE